MGRVGAVMIVAEVALSVALLGAGALFARGFEAYVTPVFHLPDQQVLSARVTLELPDGDPVEVGAATVADSARLLAQALVAELSTLPGVRTAAAGSHLPRVSPYPEPIRLEGSDQIVRAPLVHQGVGLFSVLDVEPVLGRDFEVGDTEPGASPVAIVNQAFALEHYRTTQVLGRRLRVVPHEGEGEQEPWHEIVGVVPNVMEVTGLRQAAGLYLPFATGRSFYVALRVEADPRALIQPLRRATFELDPGIDVRDVVALSGVGAENKMALGVMSSAASAVGLVTLLLSLAGIYSIVSLAVTQRTREIGVRVALGAEPRSILWSISRRSGLLVAAGGLVGGLLGFQISKLSLFTFVVPEGGPGLFLGLVLLMSLSAVVACWIPARRALSIQPVEAMRSE